MSSKVSLLTILATTIIVLTGPAFRITAQSNPTPETSIIQPGIPWYDTDGNRIYAGGANIYTENGVYYLIGEGKKVFSDCSECFNLYSSTDLVTWKFESCALNNSDIQVPPPFQNQPFYRMERPKIFKCPGTSKYTMWFHCDTDNFAMRSVGVLTSDSVTGPYTFVTPCFQPDGQDSYDMGTFVDDRGDNQAYLIRSVRNQFAGISRMTENCWNTTGITSQGPDMEGQAIMRDSNGTLHAMGSHLTGWAPNAAIFVTTNSTTLMNAQWGDEYNPTSSDTTYQGQSTFIFPYHHPDGHITFMAMFDRWNEAGPGGLDNATQLWLPMIPPSGSTPTNVSVGWTLQLANCDSSDNTQIFTIDTTTNTVAHTATNLCVTSPPNPNGDLVTLELDNCNSPSRGIQTWYVTQQRSTLSSTPKGNEANCINFNNANNVLPAGNPIIGYDCTPLQWNAQWALPKDNTPGILQALDNNGNPSGMCAAVFPPSNPNRWTIPFLSEWSLGDY